MLRGTRSGGRAMRVLVTEDDEILATALAAGLRREGMAVDVALDGEAALERLTVNRYDVVVLDRDLPGVHGDGCRDGQGSRAPRARASAGLIVHRGLLKKARVGIVSLSCSPPATCCTDGPVTAR